MLDGMNTPRLELTWVESGIELNEREANSLRHGFGRELLEHGLPYQLDATTKLELTRDGVRFRLVLPLRNDEQGES
jgi:two-component sensor histidine kinase